MNLLDRLIGWFSPQAGVRRETWRQTLKRAHDYDAGELSWTNPDWRVINQSAEFTDRYSRDLVRARARDLERNSDMMNAVIGAFVRNTVGSGYVLQAETGDQEVNNQIEMLWKTWCKKRNCDVTGTQSLNQMLRMAVRRKKIDGGILFVKRFTGVGGLPFQLQIFEVDELDSTQIVPANSENRVIGGIEYDPFHRPVGYWIRQYSIDGIEQIDPILIDAKDVIFYFSKRRPSQLREMSDMSQTITRIRDVNEFMTAVSVKQRIEACLAIFIKRIMPVNFDLGRLNPVNPANPRKSYQGKRISPGMISELNAGDEIQVVNPNGQATDAAAYLKLQMHLIAASQGLSYEAVSRDMSESTYSSARQAMIEDGLTYADEEELLKELLDEIYETFLISAVLAKRVNLPNFWSEKSRWMAHSWVKPPKPWIDPLKEANAVKIALQTGQKTFKQVSAENGNDWQSQVDDICEVLAYAQEEYGVDLGGLIFGKTAKTEASEDAKSGDDGELSGDRRDGI